MFLGETQRKILPSTRPQGLNLGNRHIDIYNKAVYGTCQESMYAIIYYTWRNEEADWGMINFNWKVKGISI